MKEEKQKGKYILQWNRTGLIIAEKEACQRGLEVIKDLRERERDKIIESWRKAEELRSTAKTLREEIRVRIIEYIRLGGLIKGKCSICSRL